MLCPINQSINQSIVETIFLFLSSRGSWCTPRGTLPQRGASTSSLLPRPHRARPLAPHTPASPTPGVVLPPTRGPPTAHLSSRGRSRSTPPTRTPTPPTSRQATPPSRLPPTGMASPTHTRASVRPRAPSWSGVTLNPTRSPRRRGPRALCY